MQSARPRRAEVRSTEVSARPLSEGECLAHATANGRPYTHTMTNVPTEGFGCAETNSERESLLI